MCVPDGVLAPHGSRRHHPNHPTVSSHVCSPGRSVLLIFRIHVERLKCYASLHSHRNWLTLNEKVNTVQFSENNNNNNKMTSFAPISSENPSSVAQQKVFTHK